MNNKTRILILADGFLIIGLCIALANVYATLIMNQPFPFPPIAPIILALIAVVAYIVDWRTGKRQQQLQSKVARDMTMQRRNAASAVGRSSHETTVDVMAMAHGRHTTGFLIEKLHTKTYESSVRQSRIAI